MSHLKISIIIPTYNYAQFITRALDSIYNQDINNNISCEIIIINDCSTDDTNQVIHNYLKIKKIKKININNQIIINIFNNLENQGAAVCRNKGITAATGDYIVFLDADDMLAENTINTICNFIIENNKKPEIILTNHSNFTANDSNNIHIIHTNKNNKISDNYKQRFIDYLFKKSISVTAGSIIFHKNFFKNTKFCESLKLNEDLSVFAHAMLNPHFYFLDFVTVYIYKHANSLRNQYKLLNEQANTSVLANIIFDEKILPKELISLKKNYLSQRYLSLFRSYYLAKQYKLAINYYHQAIKYQYTNLFKINYFSKYLRSYFLNYFVSDKINL